MLKWSVATLFNINMQAFISADVVKCRANGLIII